MEFEEEEKDDHDKDVTLSNEQERREKVLPMGSLQYSQDRMEAVHHRVQDI